MLPRSAGLYGEVPSSPPAARPPTEGGSTSWLPSPCEASEAGFINTRPSRWNPEDAGSSSPSVADHIIDLQQTAALLEEAADSSEPRQRGGSVLFVGTKSRPRRRREQERTGCRRPPLARRPADQLAHHSDRIEAVARPSRHRTTTSSGCSRRRSASPWSASSRSWANPAVSPDEAPSPRHLADLKKERRAEPSASACRSSPSWTRIATGRGPVRSATTRSARGPINCVIGDAPPPASRRYASGCPAAVRTLLRSAEEPPAAEPAPGQVSETRSRGGRRWGLRWRERRSGERGGAGE